jgi:dTDP-4-dehydrorhamnose 3,5-epimerase-like enzyme
MKSNLLIIKSDIKGLKVFQSNVFEDCRGEIWTSWEKNFFKINFNHDKFTLSKKKLLMIVELEVKMKKCIPL